MSAMFYMLHTAAQAILRQQALTQGQLCPEGPSLQDSLRASTDSKEPEDDISVDEDENKRSVGDIEDDDEEERQRKESGETSGSEPTHEETEDDAAAAAASSKWRAEKDLKFSIEKILSPAFGNDFWAQLPHFSRPVAEMELLQLQSLAGNLQRLQQLQLEQAKAVQGSSAAAAAAAASVGGQSLASLQNCLKAIPQGLAGLGHLHRQQENLPVASSALNNLQLSALQSMQHLQSLQLIQGRKSPENRKRRRSSDHHHHATSPSSRTSDTAPVSAPAASGRNARIAERSEDSESQDTVHEERLKPSTGDESSSAAAAAASGSSEEANFGPDKRGLWPAWVYCTRYSDRPSSGPRSKRTKRKEKSDEKRPRTAFTADQLQRLKKEFQENRYLTEKRRQDLAGELGLNESQIKIWFQNKRAKLKKSTGRPNPLALELMAQGLYNHSTLSEQGSDPRSMDEAMSN